MSLLAELKRRNVVRVAIAYVVLSWLVLQMGDLLFDLMGVPDWALRIVLGILVLGFVPALIVSWVYELTPEGIKRESDIDRSQSISPQTGRRLDVIIVAMLAVAIGLFGMDRMGWLGEKGSEKGSGSFSVADDGSVASTGENEPDPFSESVPSSDTESDAPPESESDFASVAVLAFDNMSPDPDNAYFAEGISEEILNLLAKIEGLQVASRTSAFSFAGSDTPIPEIARQLDVANVLEGSVRRQGDRVRITAQLIDARSDKHLWSDTFDRRLDDIFAVQDEIARAIAGALQTTLGVGSITRQAPTRDMAAYELFLRGRQLFYQRGDAVVAGLEDLRAAVSRDPEFVEAWAFLAAAAFTIPGYTDYSAEENQRLRDEAAHAAQRALELDPEQALAVAINASLEPDRLARFRGMDRAVALAPDDAGLIMWAASERMHLGGYVEEALPMLEKAYRLDPLVGINNGMLGFAYLADGQVDLGVQHIRRAGELGWNYAFASVEVALMSRGQGADLVEMYRRWLSTSPELSAPARRHVEARLAFYESGSPDAFWARFGPMDESDPEATVSLQTLLMLGELDRYFDQWQADIERGRTELWIMRSIYIPGGKPVVEHPRFLDIGEKLDLIPVWEELGYPMGCERVQDDRGDHLVCPSWPK